MNYTGIEYYYRRIPVQNSRAFSHISKSEEVVSKKVSLPLIAAPILGIAFPNEAKSGVLEEAIIGGVIGGIVGTVMHFSQEKVAVAKSPTEEVKEVEADEKRNLEILQKSPSDTASTSDFEFKYQ